MLRLEIDIEVVVAKAASTDVECGVGGILPHIYSGARAKRDLSSLVDLHWESRC
jgi:hypothetical protein